MLKASTTTLTQRLGLEQDDSVRSQGVSAVGFSCRFDMEIQRRVQRGALARIMEGRLQILAKKKKKAVSRGCVSFATASVRAHQGC